MAVQSQTTSHQVKKSQPTSAQPVSQIRRDVTSIVRIDPRTDSPKTPHSSVQFQEYVQWLTTSDTSSQQVGATGRNEKLETGRPVSEDLATTVTDPSESATVRTESADNGYALTTDVIDSELSKIFFRVDLPASVHSGNTSPAPAPHFDLRKFAAAPTPASPQTESQQLPGFPEKKIYQLANWEVPDFRWPVGVERLIYQKPKLALLLLNQATRFVRPNANRLVVCGNGRQQGASTIAIGLARWAAENSQRVLVVDADLSNPSIGTQLGLEDSFDVSWSQIKPDYPLAEALIESDRTGVCLLPLRGQLDKRGSHAMLDQLGEIIDSIALQFDLIIIDCGTANQLMNSLTRHDRLVDSLVLVHNRKKADPELYLQTVARLNHFGIHNLVVAENFSGSTLRTDSNDG